MKIEDITPKQDDAQRLLALNGVPRIYWLSAEEINLILRSLLALLGKESALYKGEYDNLAALEAAHPLPEPGSEAQLIVVDGDNLKASWDNTNKRWFEDGVYVAPGSDAAYLLKSVYDVDNDGVIDQAKDIVAMLTAGPNQYYGTDSNGNLGAFALPTGTGSGTPTNTDTNKINSFSAGYIGGLSYAPYMDFNFGSNNFKVSTDPDTPIILNPADATYSRIDLIVGNSNGTITKITGVPAENPVEPAINIQTQLKGAFILIEAGALAPSGVSLKKIYEQNVGTGGGEFAATINNGIGWNLNDTSDPQSGTKAIKGTNLQDGDSLMFTPLVKVPQAEMTELIIYIKNLSVPAVNTPLNFYIYGKTGSNRGRGIASQFFPSMEFYGYDKNNVTDWQFIILPILVSAIVEIDTFNIVNKTAGFNCLIDTIKYNDGTAPTGKEFATVGYVQTQIELATEEVLAVAKAYTDAQIAASLAWQHRYTTITTLLANQAEQTTAKPQFVFDASIDPTVNTASTWAVYELKDIAVKTGALSDYRKLSEQESMDVAAAAVEPAQVTKTVTASFTTEALSDLNYSQNGKNTLIKNGVNAINLTAGATANFVGTYMKIGTGAITFLASSGKTIVPVNGTSVMNGSVGSTATVTVDGNNVYVLISNAS